MLKSIHLYIINNKYIFNLIILILSYKIKLVERPYMKKKIIDGELSCIISPSEKKELDKLICGDSEDEVRVQ